jgi:hypothetical protein
MITRNAPFGVEIDPELGITLSANADEKADGGHQIFSTQIAVCFRTQDRDKIDIDGFMFLEHRYSTSNAVYSLGPAQT